MSTSTIAQVNSKRTIGGKNTRERMQSGRKIDWIFKREDIELRCGEAAKDMNQTKMLLDGGFKMPKVMKSMFSGLCQSSPSSVMDISVPGFLVSS